MVSMHAGGSFVAGAPQDDNAAFGTIKYFSPVARFPYPAIASSDKASPSYTSFE